MKNQIKDTNWDHIIVSVSGGKDSSALMLHALENFPKEKLTCLHAIIDIDWHETKEIVVEQCAQFNLPLIMVQAADKDGKEKGFLSKLTGPRKDRKTGEIKQNLFPDMGNRWCTSELKLAPIHKYVRSLKGNILVLVGERREESTQRSKLEAIRPNTKLSVNGRNVVDYSPILDMTEVQVWDQIKAAGVPIHPCYTKYGVKRASCAICIFSSPKDIKQAAIHAPDIVAKYIRAEQKIDHTFKYKPATKKRPALKETVADILTAQGINVGELLTKN